MRLLHTIPQMGPVEVDLYSPADVLYERMWAKQEVGRLEKLRHLGSISYTFPGTRHARWDYTMAMLYYIRILRAPKFSGPFRIGSVNFSSGKAALQSVALAWNVGHVPGTFAVEKGIMRYLQQHHASALTSPLPLDHLGEPEIEALVEQGHSFLASRDYLGLARWLSLRKIISWSEDRDDPVFALATSFLGPFMLGTGGGTSRQFPKLWQAFSLIRHLAYLTIDTPMTSLHWTPHIPTLYEQMQREDSVEIKALADKISEVISPIERMTYEAVYHSESARKEAAVVAKRVHELLEADPDPASRIIQWQKAGWFRTLHLGRRRTYAPRLYSAGTVRFRSHFAQLSQHPSDVERTLSDTGFTYPLVSRYRAWNSDALYEPDELIIDALQTNQPDHRDVGKLMIWLMGEFDNVRAERDNFLAMVRKGELDQTYRNLLGRAMTVDQSDWAVWITPWPLSNFGVLVDEGLTDMACWAAPSMLDDEVTRHVVRDRSTNIPDTLRSAYAELMGLKKLREHLRSKWRTRTPRQRCLVVAGNLVLRRDKRASLEFDGGIATVATRGGGVTWYGLETKSGKGNPELSLSKRLKGLGLDCEVTRLGTKHAYAEISGDTWKNIGA